MSKNFSEQFLFSVGSICKKTVRVKDGFLNFIFNGKVSQENDAMYEEKKSKPELSNEEMEKEIEKIEELVKI